MHSSLRNTCATDLELVFGMTILVWLSLCFSDSFHYKKHIMLSCTLKRVCNSMLCPIRSCSMLSCTLKRVLIACYVLFRSCSMLSCTLKRVFNSMLCPIRSCSMLSCILKRVCNSSYVVLSGVVRFMTKNKILFFFAIILSLSLSLRLNEIL